MKHRLMRKLRVVAWLVTGLILLALHWRYGDAWTSKDAAAADLSIGYQFAARGDWNSAATLLKSSESRIRRDAPEDKDIALLTAAGALHAQWQGGKVAESLESTEKILRQVSTDPAVSPQTVNSIRRQLARDYYYTAWALRLGHAQPSVWFEIAERARQHFRILAEDAKKQHVISPSTAQTSEVWSQTIRDLEAVVQLQRMDLRKLQTRELPPRLQMPSAGQQDLNDQFTQAQENQDDSDGGSPALSRQNMQQETQKQREKSTAGSGSRRKPGS